VSNSQFGPILADAKGLSLYTATGDSATQTGCTGSCLTFWPPLLLPAGQAQPIAGPGVSGLGTFMRADGTQVTYHGKPLYTWIKDTRPGQVTGEGVVDSGGTWHVARIASANAPASSPATQAPAPPTTKAPSAPSSGGASF
jgi:predicted lipoprotein with Yx(FWY)xxD motif